MSCHLWNLGGHSCFFSLYESASFFGFSPKIGILCYLYRAQKRPPQCSFPSLLSSSAQLWTLIPKSQEKTNLTAAELEVVGPPASSTELLCYKHGSSGAWLEWIFPKELWMDTKWSFAFLLSLFSTKEICFLFFPNTFGNKLGLWACRNMMLYVGSNAFSAHSAVPLKTSIQRIRLCNSWALSQGPKPRHSLWTHNEEADVNYSLSCLLSYGYSIIFLF